MSAAHDAVAAATRAPAAGASAASAATPAAPGLRARLPDLLLALVVAASTAFYLALSRPLWFFGDDWDFLLRRGTVPDADLGLWRPHNEHWSTGPILVFRLLFSVFGLRHYLPYALTALLAHAAVVVLLYVLLARFSVRRWVCLAVAAVVAFDGAGAENLLWDFQIGFVGSVAFGLLALWCYDRYDTSGWRIWPTWCALAVGLAFSTVAVAMVVMTAGYASLRRGVRSGALVAAVPAAVFLVWFLLVGRMGLTSGGTPVGQSLRLLPRYVWTGLTSAWEQASGVPGSGAVIVLALLACLVATGHGRAVALAWAGTVAAFFQLVLSGMGRAATGVEQATASRYAYLVIAMMAAALALPLDSVFRRLPAPRALTAALGLAMLGLVVLGGIDKSVSFRDARLSLLGTLRDRVLAAATLAREGATILNPRLDPTYNPDLTMDLLKAEQILRELPALPPSEQGELDAAAHLQVLVAPGDVPVPPASAVALGAELGGASAPAAGCSTLTPRAPEPSLDVQAGPQGAKITVTGEAGTLTTALRRGGLTSVEVPWTVPAGVPQTVATSAADATLVVGLPGGGPVRVCV